jgi:hypothetical protein
MTCGGAEAQVSLRSQRDLETVIGVLTGALKDSEFELVGPPLAPFTFHVPPGYENDATTVAFCSDAPLFGGKFDKIMMFGPGSIVDAHTPHERLGKAELHAAVEMLCSVALVLCELEEP